MTSIIEKIKEQFANIKDKKIVYVAGIGVVALGMTAGWLGIRDNSYAVYVGSERVAIVKEKTEVEVVLEDVISSIEEELKLDVAVKEEVTIEPTHSSKKELSAQNEVASKIKEKITYDVKAYAIEIDGEERAIVKTEEEVIAILSTIATGQLPEEASVSLELNEELIEVTEKETTEAKDPMVVEPVAPTTPVIQEEVATEVAEPTTPAVKISEVNGLEVLEVESGIPTEVIKKQATIGAIEIDGQAYDFDSTEKVKREMKSFDFNEKVTISEIYTNQENIITSEEAVDVLLSNTDEVVEYELEEGDNIWDIARAHNTTMDRILEINPQIKDETRMQIGEIIKVEAPDPILSIATTQQATFKELIPSEIEYVEFSDLYKDETKVYQEGHDGLKEITVLVHKVNGKEVNRDLISEKVMKEPKTKVMAYGTKPKPKAKPTNNSKGNSGASAKSNTSGKFMHPLNGAGRISSNYGGRGSGFHRGIDIAASAGTPVYASAAGTVTYSGYNSGGFGKLIILDHGNGYETYYAHNSSLYAQVGQYVSKGQNIASVGSTGNSTGNHVHFEIRKNGSPINPYSYIY